MHRTTSLSFIRRSLGFSLLVFFFFLLEPHFAHAVYFESGIPGVGPEGAAGKPIPSVVQYVSYLYIFVLSVVGIAGFVSLVVWGTVWVATGVVDKKAMALESIKNTFIGIGIALTAYAILYTINPDLVRISTPSTQIPGAVPSLPTSPLAKCSPSSPCGADLQCLMAAGETTGVCVPVSTFCTNIKTLGECDAQSSQCRWCPTSSSWFSNKDIGTCKNITDVCP